MILKLVYPDAKFTFLHYDSEEHCNLVADTGMLFCDFSPRRETSDEFLRAGAIVLDHHAKAVDIVKPFVDAGLGAFGDEKTDPGVCGAVLAYREVLLPMKGLVAFKPIEELATLAGIRDTWQLKDPRWIAACEQGEALRFWPIDKLLAASIDDWPELLKLGPMLYERTLASAKKNADAAYRFTTKGGLRVAAFERGNISDASNFIGTSADIIVSFSYIHENDAPPVMILSCRSRGDFDVGSFCVAHGGGGHTKSAGFRRQVQPNDPHPYALIKNTIERYEPVQDRWKAVVYAWRTDAGFRPKAEYAKLVSEDIARPRVYIESPLAGDFARNVKYARLCLLDSLRKGEAPYASHLLYTLALDDRVDTERAWGMQAGHEWRKASDKLVVYTDLGISKGMTIGVQLGEELGMPVEHRQLPPDLMALLDSDEAKFGTDEAVQP
jgi:hypothetical protein